MPMVHHCLLIRSKPWPNTYSTSMVVSLEAVVLPGVENGCRPILFMRDGSRIHKQQLGCTRDD